MLRNIRQSTDCTSNCHDSQAKLSTQRDAKAQYTPPTPTRLNCRVCKEFATGDSLHEPEQIYRQRSRVVSCWRCERTRRQSWPCAIELLRLVTSDGIMTPLLKKLSISIKVHVLKPLCSVSKLSTSTDSVGSSRELIANSCTRHRRRRRDTTRQLSLVGVGGVYWA